MKLIMLFIVVCLVLQIVTTVPMSVSADGLLSCFGCGGCCGTEDNEYSGDYFS